MDTHQPKLGHSRSFPPSRPHTQQCRTNGDKPISQSSALQAGNNTDKEGRLEYWGKFRKPAVRTKLSTGHLKSTSPIRKHWSSFEKDQNFLGSNGDTEDAHQLFDEMPEREKPDNKPSSPNVASFTTDDAEKLMAEKDEKNNQLRLFRAMFKLLKKEEGKPTPRIDQEACKVLKESGKLTKWPIEFGPVSGVEIGDEFEFRVELMIMGLHSHTINGIDYVKMSDGRVLATCVVATEGYLDTMVRPDMLIYSGEGGNFEVKGKGAKDQELKKGNLALMNSIKERNFVRVVRGVKPGFGNVNAKGGTKKTVFVYDGLYRVVDCKEVMGPYGKAIFQFELRRCKGQKCIKWEKYKVV